MTWQNVIYRTRKHVLRDENKGAATEKYRCCSFFLFLSESSQSAVSVDLVFFKYIHFFSNSGLHPAN